MQRGSTARNVEQLVTGPEPDSPATLFDVPVFPGHDSQDPDIRGEQQARKPLAQLGVFPPTGLVMAFLPVLADPGGYVMGPPDIPRLTAVEQGVDVYNFGG